MEKTCFKCGEIKPFRDFYRHNAMSGGRLNKCKECAKADARENRILKADYYKEYEKSRAMLPHRVKARKEYSKTEAYSVSRNKTTKKYRRSNPIKYAAHNAVNNAVRGGLIEKPSNCEVCGGETTLHGHHDDYAKPLDIRWLCAACHKQWHALHGEAKNAA